MKHIDPTKELSQEHFCELFEQLPLNDTERTLIRDEYNPIYKAFIVNGVSPEDSWVATRNIFIIKETQIGDRMKAMKEN